jgi:hypothetical protein
MDEYKFKSTIAIGITTRWEWSEIGMMIVMKMQWLMMMVMIHWPLQ